MACMWSAMADPKSCDQIDNNAFRNYAWRTWSFGYTVLTKSIVHVIVIRMSEVFHVGVDV